jgi:hypothetical protein
VTRDAELIWDLRRRCDYSGAVRLLPRVLRELHAHTVGNERLTALKVLTRTAEQASFIVRSLGYPGEAWLASDRAHDAAVESGDPVMLGLSAWSLSHAATAAGAYGRGLTVATRAADHLQAHMNAPAAIEMQGMLHLTCAFAATGAHEPAQVAARLDEAQALAERIDDTDTLGLMFGPTNVRLWRLSMEVDGGDPGRAVEIAKGTNPALVNSPARRADFYTDTSRALTRIGKNDEAVRMVLTAERIAPQRVRTSRLVQETTRTLLDRAQRRAGGAELRGLCERMGIAV